MSLRDATGLSIERWPITVENVVSHDYVNRTVISGLLTHIHISCPSGRGV